MEDPSMCVLPGIMHKTAVVTGGAAGIGREICAYLAALGARTAIIDLNEEKGKETAAVIKRGGGEARFTRGDVTNESDMKRCMDETAAVFGGIDILISNAGIASPIPFEKLTLDMWKRIIDVNLTGAFVCTKAALPHLLARDRGVIVMISSGSAITGSGTSASYAASKGGLNSFVRALSRELAPKGIRVNGVAPRSIESELLTKIYPQDHLAGMAKEIPLGRMGTNTDVAHVTAFLSSDLASFISGETLLVDGGRTFGK
jgi:3-oxoacyl-[acyl-carrier protein] reductase